MGHTHMYVLLLGDLYTSGLLITKRICNNARLATSGSLRIPCLQAAHSNDARAQLVLLRLIFHSVPQTPPLPPPSLSKSRC